jgi:eukaryotic-like serine/threonine-protein kinase
MQATSRRWAITVLALAALTSGAWIFAQDGAEAPAGDSVGALSPQGKTIDPLTVAPKQADQVWAAKTPPAGTPVKAYPGRIVSYADDMARHDCGSYCKPREYEYAEDVDVDRDGKVDDDYVAYMSFSMTETLSMPNWPGPGQLSSRLPERMSATMHGGRSWWVANATKKNRKKKFCFEIGINPNHSPPFWDPRAEDHPLQGSPDEDSPDSFLRNYITKIWKKADFLNGGDDHRVTFDDSSRLASICTRGYWYGFDEVRMVVLDGDPSSASGQAQWYISDMEQFDIPKDMKEYAGGRCFVCYPTKATWAKWKPEGYRNDFDAKKATFAKHDFQDVQAVGWHLAKVNELPSNSHVKWYGFEADAVVNRPEQPSVNLAMATIKSNALPEFNITTCEIPYAFWKKVFRYGDAPINTLDARYTFARSGDMGSMRFSSGKHVQNEPVTNLTFYDMLAFANCLSQMEGKTPVYYVDPEFKIHFRNMHIATYAIGRQSVEGVPPFHCNPKLDVKPQPKIHVNWAADGYRLPTASEWIAAAGSLSAAETSDGTQPVGQGKPNANGLYDVAANVREMAWSYGDVFDPETHDTQTVLGGDFHGKGDPSPAERAASPYGDTPYDGNHNIGLRIVNRKAGLPAPAQKQVQTVMWQIKKGQKTLARQAAEKVAEPLLAMADIPAGEFVYPEGRLKMKMLPFKMGTHEVSFAQWEAVRHWGEANGYEFSRLGHMGSMYWYHFAHTPNEPVTFNQWHDVAVWCNALSEMEGRTPFYFTDPAKTQVYRKAWAYRPIKVAGWEIVNKSEELKKYGPPRNNEPWLFEKWEGNGYRLPTVTEFEYALQGGTGSRFYWGRGKSTDHAWSIFNSGGTTHEVGTRKPNAFGLYDMIGNVWEWTNSRKGSPKSRNGRYDTTHPKYSRFWAYGLKKYQYDVVDNPMRLGGSWFWGGVNFWHSQWSFHEMAHGYMPDHGFRVVTCEAGSQPADGNFPVVIPDILVYDVNDYDDLDGQAYRGNIRRDGVHQTTGVAAFKGVKWQVALGGPVKSSPVVVDGLVCIGGAKGFHALDAVTGEQKWLIPVKGGVTSSACIANGVVYFGGMDSNVYAADLKTGDLKWKIRAKKPVTSSPAVAYDTVFFFGSGGIRLVNATTGKPVGAYGRSMPGRAAVALYKDCILGTYGSANFNIRNGMSFFDPSSGFMEWTSDQEETPSFSDGDYFSVSSGRGGYSFAKVGRASHSAKKIKWVHFLEEHLPQPKRAYVSCAQSVWDGKVFTGTDNGILYVFDASRGTKLKEVKIGAGMHAPLSISAKSGIVYVGTEKGEVVAVSGKTFKELWRTKVGGPVQTSPWPMDGVVYVGSNDGNVYALEGQAAE